MRSRTTRMPSRATSTAYAPLPHALDHGRLGGGTPRAVEGEGDVLPPSSDRRFGHHIDRIWKEIQ